MPDILIRGAQAPKSCKDCPVFEQTLAFPDYIKRCRIGADLPQPWPLQYEKRGDNCSLHQLPPHGELIDLDERINLWIYDEQHLEWGLVTKTVRDFLLPKCETPPTVVIPASEETT